MEQSDESFISPPVSDESFKVPSRHSDDDVDEFERPRIVFPDDDILYNVSMTQNC